MNKQSIQSTNYTNQNMLSSESINTKILKPSANKFLTIAKSNSN